MNIKLPLTGQFNGSVPDTFRVHVGQDLANSKPHLQKKKNPAEAGFFAKRGLIT
jgi:hypothetical protein